MPKQKWTELTQGAIFCWNIGRLFHKIAKTECWNNPALCFIHYFDNKPSWSSLYWKLPCGPKSLGVCRQHPPGWWACSHHDHSSSMSLGIRSTVFQQFRRAFDIYNTGDQNEVCFQYFFIFYILLPFVIAFLNETLETMRSHLIYPA